MNGFNNLPNKSDQNTFVFYANASSSLSGSFQTWNVPEYATFLHFTIIGGGAGGGSGYFSNNVAITAGGGGGGAPAGMVAVSIPAILLPKTIYLQVGYGGKGGTAQTVTGNGLDGQSGSLSYICLYPEINNGSVLIQSSNIAPGGGRGGTIAGGSTGTAITLADVTNLKWLGITGNTVSQTAGIAGANSNTNASPIVYAGLLTGGAGAGGTRNTGLAGNGGNITFSNLAAAYAISAYNIAGGSNGQTIGLAGGPGGSGLFQWRPFIATGGAGGGGGGNLGRGGNGGKGAYGCGGGGGGAGTATSSGDGGDGGDGLIIITVA